MMEDDNKKQSRREREREARRLEILEAARKVFGARGYEGATLDDVAREAEFAKGTLYSYFDSKAELFAAVIEHEFDELLAKARAALTKEKDVAAAARVLVRIFLEFFESRSDFYRVAMAHQDTGEREDVEMVRSLVMKRVAELGDLLGSRLAAGIRDGLFKEYDARFLGFLLLGIVHYYSTYVLRYSDTRVPLTDGTDMLCDIYLDGVRWLRPDTPEVK